MLLKRGVVELDELAAMTTIFGRRKKASVRLYAEILRGRPDHDVHLPLVLESLVVGPRAFKRTADRRFEELDAALLELVLSIERKPGEPLRVHDMGASDGRTSAELYARLRSLGPIEFTASDLYRTLYLVEPADRAWWVAFDEDLQPIQHGRWGFVFSTFLPDNPLLYPINTLADWWLRRTIVPQAQRTLAEADAAAIPDLASRQVRGLTVTSLLLICRECRELMQRDSGFRFMRHDVRRPTPMRFHLIRALNVLNHVDRAGQIEAIRSCRASLCDGGLLVIGRSSVPESHTHASIWRREGDALTLLRDLDGGAELKPLFPEALGRATA